MNLRKIWNLSHKSRWNWPTLNCSTFIWFGVTNTFGDEVVLLLWWIARFPLTHKLLFHSIVEWNGGWNGQPPICFRKCMITSDSYCDSGLGPINMRLWASDHRPCFQYNGSWTGLSWRKRQRPSLRIKPGKPTRRQIELMDLPKVFGVTVATSWSWYFRTLSHRYQTS